MTASEFASLLRAKPAGKGKWNARCPAHPDRNPSLAIKEGDGGAVLVKCWPGCSAQAVVAAMGLTLRDLFPARHCDARTIAAARRAAAKREKEERRRKEQERARMHHYRNTLDQVALLGRALARHPEDEQVAQRFHAALDRQRKMEARNGWE